MTKEAQQAGRDIVAANPAAWEQQARQRLITAADTLATRAGMPPFDATARQRPDRRALGDLELMAQLAEALVARTGKGAKKS